jgi:hypothetical protein
MVDKITKYFDKSALIGAALTVAILFIFSKILAVVCLVGWLLLLIGNIKWHVIDFARLNKWLINVAVVIVTLFFLVIVGEMWLQFFPHKYTGIDGVDTVGKFSDYTSRGYLTDEVFQKRDGEFRILGVGDSFSIYLGDQGKNYLNFLQQKFTDSGQGNVRIVNAGLEATGPGYYWHILSTLGDKFKPDLLLVGFFVGNDFYEADFFITVGNFIKEPHAATKKYLGFLQFRQWRLYHLLRNKYTRAREERLRKQEVAVAGAGPAPQAKAVGTFSEETFLRVEYERSSIFDKDRRRSLKRRWQECASLINKMKDWCDRRNIPLVIAVFPDQFQVDRELREAVLKKYQHIPPENLDLGYPDELIMNFCRGKSIHCLDLLGPFLAAARTETLYALRDTHWNEAGNRLAAEVIFRYLEDNGLVGARPRP